jgi:hypothetical protein
MEGVICICHENILEEQIQIELLCGHKYHTECWLRHNRRLRMYDVRCCECNEHIIPDDMMLTADNGNENIDTDTDIINLLWESDTNFKESVINYNTGLKNRNKTLQQLRAKIKSIVNNCDFSSCITIIKNKLNEMKSLVKDSEEYNSSITQERSIANKSRKIFQTWNVPIYTICKVLRNNDTAQKHVTAHKNRYSVSRIMSKFIPRFNKF